MNKIILYTHFFIIFNISFSNVFNGKNFSFEG